MLKEMLLELEYGVSGIAKSYEAALQLLGEKKEINLCFIDINLEDHKSGFDVVKAIREKYFLPFIFLTSYSDKKTVEEAALLKPEAYLVKPFSFVELLARVRAMSRRGPIQRTVMLEVGDLRLDSARHQVWRGDTPIEIGIVSSAFLASYVDLTLGIDTAIHGFFVYGTLRGVRIIWKPVPGLTAAWMRQAML